ncbi:DNA polymerase I [Lysinibacillus sp. 2017]|uniref:DNA polymerase I n=1 Tax=Lysinibacillus sp. 2017 TaxID=2169540 RepID=UPI000D526737|nr:DNA polymerase I [Lysinibacillus sp. 2017]TGN35842.1 DNA polymerase I [Lysinibacillus sp. S2017]
MSRKIQNSLIAFIMATSVSALFVQSNIEFMKTEIFHIPVLFIVILGVSLFIAEDVRDSFKKVLWFDKREDKRPIWQVGIGSIFFFTQIGFVEVFARHLMHFNLGGMPLYCVFAFMNAFLLTVIYEEIFYEEEKTNVQIVKFKNRMK